MHRETLTYVADGLTMKGELFCEPGKMPATIRNCAEADRLSWELMKTLFRQTFDPT